MAILGKIFESNLLTAVYGLILNIYNQHPHEFAIYVVVYIYLFFNNLLYVAPFHFSGQPI